MTLSAAYADYPFDGSDVPEDEFERMIERSYGLFVPKPEKRGHGKMFEIKYVSENDKSFWFSLDKHLSENEFVLKIRDKRGYIISDGNKPVGVMRYNLFWDNTPFLTLIYIDEQYRGKGLGKQAMLYWENEMRELGYKIVMTSTQADEQAQHFYRRLGYLDRGCLVLDNTPYEQPQEIFMVKIN